MLVDIHAHVHFNIFKDDADKVISRAREAGVFIVAPSTKLSTSRSAIAFAEKYRDNVFPAIGMHPLYTKENPHDPDEEEFADEEKPGNFELEAWRKLALNEMVVALGEIGLDYVKRLELTEEERDFQEKIFKQQLDLALEAKKPVIVHCRDGVVDGIKRNAHDDILRILEEYIPKGLRGVSHCFSGNKEQAKRYVDLGFGLSFAGLVTYNGAWDKIIREISLKDLFIETDSPYLTPVPHRQERNEPINVRYVAEHIAKIKETSFEEVAGQTSFNAQKMFNLLL